MSTDVHKIRFNFTTMEWEGITYEQVKIWERLYPNTNVVQVLKVDMIQWLDKKRGTKVARKKNWKAFICGWLKREQLRGVGIL
jgi:hypothetical protein